LAGEHSMPGRGSPPPGRRASDLRRCAPVADSFAIATVRRDCRLLAWRPDGPALSISDGGNGGNGGNGGTGGAAGLGVAATITVEGGPGGVAVSPTGPDAGDTNSSSNTVSVINPATNTVVAAIPVGTTPFAVAVSPTGPEAGYTYVTNALDNTVSVIG
jgi:YVTN family beta-propeller protein